MSSAQRAIVLYGRSAFDSQQNIRELARRYALHANVADTRVASAFADLSGPSLPQVLDDLARDGVTQATVVTCMVPADPTHASWLPGALAAWRSGAAVPIDVRLAPAVETAIDLVAAIDTCLAADDAVDVTTIEPSLGKPGWSKIPEHGRQVFFCVGARCLHRGAEALFQHLRGRMKAHRALNAGPKRVMCARSSCLCPCNLGPLMTVWPDGTWYGELDPARLDRIVDEHFCADRPISDAIVHLTADRAGI